MTDLTETDIGARLRRLEERVLRGPIDTPTTVTFPDGIGGGDGGGGAQNRTLNIPTTNLTDTEEFRQWFVTDPDATTTAVETILLNEAGQAPDGLDLVVYNYTDSVEVYRNGSTRSEPTDVSLTAGHVHYVSIENQSSAEQNANAVLSLEVE